MKVAVFGEKMLYSGKVVLLGQKRLYLGKVVVFCHNWLYSGKSGCNLAKMVVIKQKWM